MYLTKDHFPNTGLGSLPELDIELSLQVPSQAPIWRSVVSDARLATGFNTKRGRSRELDQFVAGTLDLELDNRDRGFDPEHSASPIFEHIKPERRIRVLAKWDGTQYVVFDGFVDGFEQKYGEKGLDASAVITASDGFKLLAATELPSSFYEMVVATDRPDHWWKLDEASGQTIALDTGVSGANPMPGIYRGGATLGSSAVPDYDGDRTAVDFDGTNDNVAIPAAATPTATSYSIEGWFNRGTQDGTTADVLVIAGGTDLGSTHFIVFTAVSAWLGLLLARVTTGALGVGTDYYVQSLARVDDAADHHYAVTVDGPNQLLTLYVDGVSQGTAAPPATTLPSGGLVLAATTTASNNGYPYDGLLAHAALWDGTVLTATQVLAHYNAGKNGLTGEATGTRVGRVLNYLGWPTSDRDIDTGSSTVGAHDLSGGSALDYLQTLADTEQGQMYMGLDSAMSSDSTFKFVWRQRHAIITASRSSAPGLSPTASQATFSDDGADLRYADVLIDYGEHRLYNEAEVTRRGGAPQRASDTDSQREYLKRTYTKSTLDASDNTAFDHATWAVNRFSDPEYRIIGLVVKPQRDPTNLWPHVLGREIGDRITVQLTPMGVGSEISKAAIIEGVEHSMQDGEWTTTWRLSEADSTAYWVLDDEALSVLDSTTVPAF